MIERKIVSITMSTFIKMLIIALILWLGYLILDILILLFVALILASLIDPLADWFQKYKLPRGLAVMGIYVVFLGLFAVIGIILVPAIVTQFSQLSANFGHYWNQFITSITSVKELLDRYGLLDNITNYLPNALQSSTETVQKLIGSVVGFFNGVFSLGLVLVLTFYLVVEENGFKKMINTIVPAAHRDYAVQLWGRIKEKLGLWLRGQLALDLIVGFISYVGLLVLDVQYALILALLSGLFETIPYAGPIFSAIVAVLLTFLQTGGWAKPLAVAVLFLLIQQLENNVLVPKIMKRAVGVNPVLSIISLLVGYRLLGVMGALLAIPVATVLTIVWSDISSYKEKKQP